MVLSLEKVGSRPTGLQVDANAGGEAVGGNATKMLDLKAPSVFIIRTLVLVGSFLV